MTDFLNKDRFLVIASSSTGNNIFCTPAIRLLKKALPEATVDVVALSKLSAEVFVGNPDIQKLFILSKGREIDKLAKQYTQLIVLNKNALKKLGQLHTNFMLVPPMTDSVHHAEHLLQFMASLLNVTVTDADRQYVIQSQLLSAPVSKGLANAANRLLINIHLGCGTTVLHGWKFFYARRADDKKLWSIDAYIALGNALMAAIPNLSISITGTSNESFLAKKFENNVPNTINLVGKTTVSDLYQLMQQANLFIAHDCGVFHVAAATDIPIVGLYGPTNPIATGPFPNRPQHIIIKKAEMADISVDEVVSAAQTLLEKFPRVATA